MPYPTVSFQWRCHTPVCCSLCSPLFAMTRVAAADLRWCVVCVWLCAPKTIETDVMQIETGAGQSIQIDQDRNRRDTLPDCRCQLECACPLSARMLSSSGGGGGQQQQQQQQPAYDLQEATHGTSGSNSGSAPTTSGGGATGGSGGSGSGGGGGGPRSDSFDLQAFRVHMAAALEGLSHGGGGAGSVAAAAATAARVGPATYSPRFELSSSAAPRAHFGQAHRFLPAKVGYISPQHNSELLCTASPGPKYAIAPTDATFPSQPAVGWGDKATAMQREKKASFIVEDGNDVGPAGHIQKHKRACILHAHRAGSAGNTK